MNPLITSLAYDSRQVGNHSLFFAVEGSSSDGHKFIPQALERGAAGVISERPEPYSFPVPWIKVPDIRASMAILASHFHGEPSKDLQLAAITGTNGKTTTSYLMHAILSAHSPSLLMGTVETRIGHQVIASKMTTPEAVDIQQYLAQTLREGGKTGVLEVSSHALAMKRVYRCHFPVAVFTNLSQDHLDFHLTLEDYFQAKRLLFQTEYNPGLRYAALNGDDSFSKRVNPSAGVKSVFFGFDSSHEVHPIDFSATVEGTRMRLRFFGGSLDLVSPLIGKHNGYNLMAAATACHLLGFSNQEIAEGISRLQCVPGRFERVMAAAPFSVFVDYAHTPHALENVLELCRGVCTRRVICVFGCGGDRDRAKRPLMGRIATQMADFSILTSDNPRREDPAAIIDEIQAGIPSDKRNFRKIVNRRDAIAHALKVAGPGDLVLVAGKGHETYQETHGQRAHFDDREVVLEVL